MEDFFALKFKPMWAWFRREHFSFWMICGYLIIEYVRPQSIIPALSVLPWGQGFLMLSLLGFMMDRKARRVKDPINKWLIAFLGVIVLSCMNAYYSSFAWSFFNNFFFWVIIYFLIINIVNSEKRLFIFLAVFLLASFKLSSHGARTWAMRGFAFTDWGLMGPPGYFANSGELAIQMLMFAPIAYRLAIVCKPYLTKLKFFIFMLMPVTAAMTVMGASSRGGQLGMLVQVYLTFLKGRINFRAILIVGVLAAVGYFALPKEQLQRFQSAGNDRTSEQRLLYWKHGLEMIRENPVLGVGFYNFAPYYEAHFRYDMLYETAQLPHNIFVQVGTDTGLVGLFVYVVLIIKIFRASAAVRKMLAKDKQHWLYQLSLGLDAAFVGFLVAGQFVTVGYYPFMWINMAFVIAMKNIATNISKTTLPAVR
jgi:putative inorganic carbon (hco3(-)) transporter